MRKDKDKAILLRSDGKSYREIKAELGVPVATLSDWFRDQDWSKTLSAELGQKALIKNKARIVHLGKIRGENLSRLYKDARKEAEEEFQLLKNHPLFVAGVMIYWGEGDKASKSGFRVTNTDPEMIRIFLSFLLKVCRAPSNRIKASLLIYPDLDVKVCEEYWISSVGLPKESFTRTSRIQGRHKTKRLQYGICTLYFSSRFLKEKMLVWIDLFGKEF